jgi:integrase
MGGCGIKLRYVHHFRDQTGKARYYFRRHGRRVTLPGLPGSSEFMAVYQECLAETATAPAERIVPPSKGTIAALVLAYYGSNDFTALAASTQTGYRSALDAFVRTHGHRLVRQMKREHIQTILGGMADRPGAANKLRKRLLKVIRFGLDNGWLSHDPMLRIRSYKSTEWHTWTEGEIAAFEDRWPVGTKQRLAFALLLYTGQRGGDVRNMVWTDISGRSIRVAQSKTSEKLVVPLHPDLRKILAVTKREHASILATARGASFTSKGFQNYVAKAIDKTTLPDRCIPHGLRKAAARRLAEAGCSTKQIAAITGHRTLSEIERYTRAAEQEKLAKEAMSQQVRRTKRRRRVAN